MKKSLRILSLLLAVVMIMGTMSVMGSAYQAFRGDGVTLTYDDTNKPTFNAEQYASMALDELDRMLAKEQLVVDIYVATLDLSSVDTTLHSVEELWTTVKSLTSSGLLGNVGGLIDLTAVAGTYGNPGPRRATGSSVNGDLQVIWSLLDLIGDLNPIVQLYASQQINLGVVQGFVSDYLFNVRELLFGLLYGLTGMGDTKDPVTGETIEYDYFDDGANAAVLSYSQPGGALIFLQDLLNKLVLGEWKKLDNEFYGPNNKQSNVVYTEYIWSKADGTKIGQVTGLPDTATYDYYGWVHPDRWVTFGLGNAYRVNEGAGDPTASNPTLRYTAVDVDGAANVYDFVEPLLLQAYNGLAVPVLQRLTLNWIRGKLGYTFDSKYETYYVKDLVDASGAKLYPEECDEWYTDSDRKELAVNPDYDYCYTGTAPENMESNDSKLFDLFDPDNIYIPYAVVDSDINSTYGTFIKALNHNAYAFVNAILVSNKIAKTTGTDAQNNATTTFSYTNTDTNDVCSFTLTDGTNDKLIHNACELVRFVLEVTGDEFFSDVLSAKGAIKDVAGIRSLDDQQVLAYIIRSIINSLVDGIWIEQTADTDTVAGAAAEAVKQLAYQDLPGIDYTLPKITDFTGSDAFKQYNIAVTEKVLAILMDIAAFKLNTEMDTNLLTNIGPTAAYGTTNDGNSNATGLVPIQGNSGVYGTVLSIIAHWGVNYWACTSGNSDYGTSTPTCLLNIALALNGNNSPTADNVWTDLQTILNSLLPITTPTTIVNVPDNRPIIYAGVANAVNAQGNHDDYGYGNSLKTLLFDYVIFPVLNLDLTNFYNLFERNANGAFATDNLEQVIIDLLHRVFDLLFPNVFTHNIRTIDGIINNSLLATMVQDLLISLSATRTSNDYDGIQTTNGGVITGRGKLIAEVALPIVCLALGLTDDQSFAQLENYIPSVINDQPYDFQIFNGSSGINTSYRDKDDSYKRKTDKLFTYEIALVSCAIVGTNDTLNISNINVGDTLAGGASKKLKVSGQTPGQLLEIKIGYKVKDEYGNYLGGSDTILNSVKYVYVGSTDKGDDESLVKTTIGGLEVSYPTDIYINGGLTSKLEGYSFRFKDAEDNTNKTVTVTGVSVSGNRQWVLRNNSKENKYTQVFEGKGGDYIFNPLTCDKDAYRVDYEYQKDENGAFVLDDCNMKIKVGQKAFEEGDEDSYYVQNGNYTVTTNFSVGNQTGSITTRVHVFEDYGAESLLNRLIDANVTSGDITADGQSAFNAYSTAIKTAAMKLLPPRSNGDDFQAWLDDGKGSNDNCYEALYRSLYTANKNLMEGENAAGESYVKSSGASALWSAVNDARPYNYTRKVLTDLDNENAQITTDAGDKVYYRDNLKYYENGYQFVSTANYMGHTFKVLRNATNYANGLIDREYKYTGYDPEGYQRLETKDKIAAVESYAKQMENVSAISSVESAYALHRIEIAKARLIALPNASAQQKTKLQLAIANFGDESRGSYIASTWDEYASALAFANTVVSGTANLEKVNAAMNGLIIAWKNLRLGANYEALTGAYNDGVTTLQAEEFGLKNGKIYVDAYEIQESYDTEKTHEYLRALKEAENMIADNAAGKGLSQQQQGTIDALVSRIYKAKTEMLESTYGNQDTGSYAFDFTGWGETYELNCDPLLDTNDMLSQANYQTYTSAEYGQVELDGLIEGCGTYMTTAMVEDMFTVDGYIVVVEREGNEGPTTGSIVLIVDKNGDVAAAYMLVVRGDLNLDGDIQSKDKTAYNKWSAALPGNQYDNENAAERYVYVAIDMNNDGEVDGKDYTALKNVINQNGVYNQATGKFT